MAPGRRSPADARSARARYSRRVRVDGREQVVEIDIAESPLTWLASRRGRDGVALINDAQLLAGERLRADFTRAGLTPRVTTNWSAGGGGAGGGEGASLFNDLVIAAKARLDRALGAVGPELSGVLLDVCCFLKGLEEVERERCWPARTAKVVLGLGLTRLAAHYGLASSTQGRASASTRGWQAPKDQAGEGE